MKEKDENLFNIILEKNWVKAESDQYAPHITDSNKDKFEDFFLIRIRRVSAYRLKTLDGLIALCPMLGLLGTVYGMIEVFEVLSFLGTGNPRAMSSGVAKATIPTMASMVITLFGLYFRQDLGNRIDKYIKETTLLFKKEGYSH